jgi:hypothetical protein
VLHSFGYIPRSGIAGSYGRSVLRFLRSLHRGFPEWLHQLAFVLAVYDGSFLTTSSPTHVVGVFGDGYSNRGEVEFYSAMKKNEILSFSGKCMELENIFWVRLARLRRSKFVCSPSYVDFRSRAAMWLDLDHMTRGEYIWEI